MRLTEVKQAIGSFYNKVAQYEVLKLELLHAGTQNSKSDDDETVLLYLTERFEAANRYCQGPFARLPFAVKEADAETFLFSVLPTTKFK